MNTADFKALREECGLTQQDVADAMDVLLVTEKRWEEPGRLDLPEKAQTYLREQYRRMLEIAEFATDKAVELSAGTGAQHVVLTYYRDQEQYDKLGRDEGPVGLVNAAARLARRYIEAEGLTVEFRYPNDGAISTPGSNY